MLIGYCRPFQDDINCVNQLEQLKAIPCDQYQSEEHSSAKRRVVLSEALHQLQPGDTLIVSKLFTLADSTRHLDEVLEQIHGQGAYFYSLYENIDTREPKGYLFYQNVKALLSFQSDIISENTKKGMYEAKEKGQKLGRPRKLDENIKRAISMHESKQYSLAQIQEETGISKSTLYRYLES
jgi:DNA invertase Pin-like site-specific DNA recombinase